MATEEEFYNAKLTIADMPKHTLEKSWLVKLLNVEEVEESCAGQQFDFNKLRNDFAAICHDFGLAPKDRNDKMYQFYFALKVLFTVGPESRNVKKGVTMDKSWKFTFKYQKADTKAMFDKSESMKKELEELKSDKKKENKEKIKELEEKIKEFVGEAKRMEEAAGLEKCVVVSTYKSVSYKPHADQAYMLISVKQASLLALETFNLICEHSKEGVYMMTPLSAAIFPRDCIPDLADILKVSTQEAVKMVNSSCQSGGHYLDASDGSVAVAVAFTATRGVKETLRMNIYTKIIKQYLRAGKTIDRSQLFALSTMATGGIPSDYKPQDLLKIFEKALAWLDKLKGTRTKLTSWHILINEFKFTVEHAPKNDRGLPNALSSVPDPLEGAPGELDLDRIMVPKQDSSPTQELDLPIISAIYTPTLRDEIVELQQSDPLISRQMQEWISIGQRGPSNQREENFYKNNYLDERGFWKFCPHNERWQLRVPAKMKERVLWEYHDVLNM